MLEKLYMLLQSPLIVGVLGDYHYPGSDSSRQCIVDIYVTSCVCVSICQGLYIAALTLHARLTTYISLVTT